MDFDVSIWNMDNMDTRNPIPGSEWAVSNEKCMFLMKTCFFLAPRGPPGAPRGPPGGPQGPPGGPWRPPRGPLGVEFCQSTNFEYIAFEFIAL